MERKLIINSLFLALSLFAGLSCKKFLNKDIQGVYSSSQYYTTSNSAIQAVNAAYAPLSFVSGTGNPLWVFGDVASDDAASGNPAASPDAATIDNFSYSATNSHLTNEWSNFYEGITNCNLVLANVPAISMDTALKTRLLGEAKFLRALYYFNLVNIYGDVPIVLTPLTPAQMQIAQSPKQSIYETVIEPDLMAALKVLPTSYSGADVGRATRGAAEALLSKVYLYQEKWDSSVVYSNMVINSGQYQLMKVYSQNFDGLHKNNQESVFEVQMLGGQTPNVGDALNQWFAPQIVGGYFCDAPNQNFVNEFEKTTAGVVDPRLDYTVGRDSMPWFNNKIFDKAWSPSTGYLTRKHQQPLSEVANKSDGNLNYVAIRFADVLLWYAEALNESGHTADALIPLNRVRKRARESYRYDSLQIGYPNIPAGLLPDITSTNQLDVRKAIQHERRVELGFEFHRYFDIIRWGKDYATQALSDEPKFNYDIDKHFPIPQIERDRNKALH